MLTANTEALLWTVATALIYLLIVRLLDVNEREPLWSVAVLFAVGGAAGTLLRTVVASPILDLTVVPSAIWKESAKFIGIAVGVGVLTGAARVRGWSELTDVVDGVVYGMAAGLGFACGDMLERWLASTGSPAIASLTTPESVVSRTALAGLAHGVFGAISGAGFGAALDRKSRFAQAAVLAVALLAAIGADAAHQQLAYGNALGGEVALIRGWAALLLPAVVVAALALYGLRAGRQAIVEELADEVAGGVVTEADVALLCSFTSRQRTYLMAIVTVQFRRLSRLNRLHNRQVMLALTKRRERRRAGLGGMPGEIETLRQQITQARRRLDELMGPGGPSTETK